MPRRDLTHAVEAGMPTYPGDPAVAVEQRATVEEDGYRTSALRLGSHAGTHVDAPSHTEPDGRSLGEFPVDAFRFDARLVDVDAAAREPITPAALPERVTDARDERAGDATDANDLLVFRTGWADRWGTDRYRDHPYLTAAAARACADRGWHVGLDAFSVDPTPSDRERAGEPAGVPAHHALLGAGSLILENLTNLAGLPTRFTLRAYPLALDADAAPVRAVAAWEGRPRNG